MKKIIKIFVLAYVGLITLVVRALFKVRHKKILLWSYAGRKYACNPKYISEYIWFNHPNTYEIVWALNNPKLTKVDFANKVIQKQWEKVPTLQFLFEINTAEFIITNKRTTKTSGLLSKRKGQKYIMTWHSSMSIKKVEGDVAEVLGKEYCKVAKHDSSLCDLMISGCKFRTNVFKRAFWYDGEILEKGTPRNDILFNKDIRTTIRHRIDELYGTNDKIILLYAPTFRVGYNDEIICLQWQNILSAIKEKFKKDVKLLIRLHPNMQNYPIRNISLDEKQWCNVSLYNEMQELLTVTDILLTDYSSSCFDFALTERPCFIHTMDIDKYDRGLYISPSDLPFSTSITSEELISNILSFDEFEYKAKLKAFMDKIDSFEQGYACKRFYDWMTKHSL
jgi:CDP-glycerol glycerophosphotransferase